MRPTDLAAEPGDRVAITGKFDDGRLVGTAQTLAAAPDSGFAGPNKTAVVLFTFAGEPEAPWAPEEARSKVFTGTESANAFYQEESYGQISLVGEENEAEGDVFGWLKVNTPTAGCSFVTWKEKAEAAAEAEGIDLSGYQHVIYFFPSQSSCDWLGISPENGHWAMINGDLGVHPIAHELGHNFGLEHAGAWTCAEGGARVQFSDNCTLHEYGDPFDVMGNVAPRHTNGWNLDKLGILSPSNVEKTEHSGVYTIHSAVHSTSEPTLLEIPRLLSVGNATVASWYLLEIRQTGGVFENVADATDTGVSIRVTRENDLIPSETILLDANPATATFDDAPLSAGETFDGGPVKITTESAGDGEATVMITTDDQPPSAPTGLSAVMGSEGVQLSWEASSDDSGIAQYTIYRNGAYLETVIGATHYTDTNGPAGAQTYVVYAEDGFANKSGASGAVTVTVPNVAGPYCSEVSCSVLYSYTGSTATWKVPPGVGKADFTVQGGQGAGLTLKRGGGRGARLKSTIASLTTGEELTPSVGGMGRIATEGGEGGFNGGGDGGLGSGGGGGFSSLARGSTLLLIAAGGGGNGSKAVNAETGEEPSRGPGGQGGEFGLPGGFGAPTTAAGALLRGGEGGHAGNPEDVGAGGPGGEVTGTSSCPGGAVSGVAGAPGGPFAGGSGEAEAGGGGGGGYIGGGQGGAGASDTCGSMAGSGGGGGGSSYAAPGLSPSFTGGIRRGYGQISISYSNPISVATHSYVTRTGQELSVASDSGVLSGSTAPGGDALTVSVVTAPTHGSLNLASDGSFTFNPAPGYSGTDSFSYRAADSTGNYATATIHLAVAAPPSASISKPTSGGSYTVGQVVSTAFSCTDGAGGPGLASCDDSNSTDTASGGTGYLDTSATGHHEYMVTAISKDGLVGTESISYLVVALPQPPPPITPPPSPKSEFSFAPQGSSLRKVLRTGSLPVAVTVNEGMNITLAGKTILNRRTRWTGESKQIQVFAKKTVVFGGPGTRKVTLALTREGRAWLARLHSGKFAITGRASGGASEVAPQTVISTLRR